MKLSPPEISNVPDIDWLEKNWLDMKPLDIGRFWIYGTHISDPLPAGKTGIQLDAGIRTGNHATPMAVFCSPKNIYPLVRP